MLVSGWKLLFLERLVFAPEPAHGPEWNRGAYLVQGLGHCGACHTPRNFLGAERKRAYLAGGKAEGWDAPPINADSRAPVPWTAETLYQYLRTGASPSHEIAAGPMTPVVHNLGSVPDEEVRSIAVYIASVMGQPDAERQRRGEWATARARGGGASGADADRAAVATAKQDDAQMGAMIYGSTCAVCHGAPERRPGAAGSEALHLALSTSVALPSPGNLIRIILQGMAPPDGERGPFMPGFAGALTDAQVAALVTYLRATYTDRPEWPTVEREVRKARSNIAQGH